MKRAHIIVYGRVHGVFFRWNTQRVANKLGITGWVRNIPGAVEIVAEGEEKAIKELISFCKKGPALARVDNIDISYGNPTGEFTGFEIRY